MNANNIASDKGINKWMTAGMCVGVSIILHFVVAVLICLRIIMLNSEVIEVKELEPQDEDIVVSIELETVKPELKPQLPDIPPRNSPLTAQELRELAAKKVPIEKTKPLEKKLEEPDVKPKPEAEDLIKYARTSDDQLSGKVENAILEGERDTIAASNAKTVTGAPNRPSVLGEKPQDDQHETVDTTFQDGLLEHMNRGGDPAKTMNQSPREDTPEESKTAKIDQEELKSSMEETKEQGDSLKKENIAETNKKATEFLETQKKVALNEEAPSSNNLTAREIKGLEEQQKTIASSELDPNGLKQKSQEKQQQKQKSQPNTVANKSASDSAEKGFRSEAKATVMEGTISRRSKIASKNVKATPVGKYMAQISKLVEQEWQRRCMMHADLIQPGTLRVGFMVNERGKLIQPRIISKTFGSENQESLTFQALMTVKIPPMPKNVVASQGGDPLEFRYYFRFQ